MKDKTASSRSEKQSPVLRGVLPALCVVLAVFAFAVQPPAELFRGFWRILISDAGLITDPAVTGGAGAALLNAALVLALSTALVYGMRLPVTGLTFACLFMMAGFSLLGKNILNILPVLLGGWLYARFQGEPFSKYVYQTLFATCLSPLVSFWLVHLPGAWRFAAMLGSGVAIGFFGPACRGVHCPDSSGLRFIQRRLCCGLHRPRHREHLQGAGRGVCHGAPVGHRGPRGIFCGCCA